MKTCNCGFAEGDRVITVGWDGRSDDGCWVSSMRELVGQEGVITRISHDDYNSRCVAEMDGIEFIWETRWLQKVEPYTLF